MYSKRDTSVTTITNPSTKVKALLSLRTFEELQRRLDSPGTLKVPVNRARAGPGSKTPVPKGTPYIGTAVVQVPSEALMSHYEGIWAIKHKAKWVEVRTTTMKSVTED